MQRCRNLSFEPMYRWSQRHGATPRELIRGRRAANTGDSRETSLDGRVQKNRPDVVGGKDCPGWKRRNVGCGF